MYIHPSPSTSTHPTYQHNTQEREREQRLHARMDGVPLAPHTTLKLVGHLFDSGLINQVLDVIEARGGSFRIRYSCVYTCV